MFQTLTFLEDVLGIESDSTVGPVAAAPKSAEPTPEPTVVSTPSPAIAIAPDVELESAITDLALAARVLGNLSSSLDVILDRLATKRVDVEPASAHTPIPAQATSGKPLSSLDTEILDLLENNVGSVVTTTEFRSKLGKFDLSSAISRIRKHGYIIESTLTIRQNGEIIPAGVNGYRLTTPALAKQLRSKARARAEIKDFLKGLMAEAFSAN